jgi:hypothetical protein
VAQVVAGVNFNLGWFGIYAWRNIHTGPPYVFTIAFRFGRRRLLEFETKDGGS